MYEDLPTDRTLNDEDKTPTDRTIRNDDEKRTKSRASRPNSSAKRLNSARSSRPASAALFQQPLFVFSSSNLFVNNFISSDLDLRFWQRIRVTI
jgi:hypothetical protein